MGWIDTVRGMLHSLYNFRRAGELGTAEDRHQQQAVFLLCGLYCVVAISFLCAFGIGALLEGNLAYGRVLLGFAAVTALCYGLIWGAGRYSLANHFVTLLMALLCLYLFHTGGEAATGPLWYFVFPLLALFLQGRRVGLLSVGALAVATILLAVLQAAGLGREPYAATFLERLLAVYLAVTALGYLFAWFRDEDERRLRESNQQLAMLSGHDELTGIASRRRAEIVLDVEARKALRYQSRFSLVLLRIDRFDSVVVHAGPEAGRYLLQEVAMLLKQEVRRVDMLSRWSDDSFSILLPNTALPGALKLAERIRLRITRQTFRIDGTPLRATLSIGVAQFAGQHVSRFVHEVRGQLELATRTGGNCVMHADVAAVPDNKPAANGN